MIELVALSARNLEIPFCTIPPGVTAVIGLNGAGKSTLLEVCCGILEPESGIVLVDGRPPRSIDAGWVASRPDRSIIFSRVRDELAAAGRFSGRPPSEVEDRVRETAGKTGIADLLDRGTRTLSGGEKAVVALSAALASRPVLLALDEFDGYLDGTTARELAAVVRGAGVPYVLWSTHDSSLAARADRAIVLEDGRVAAEGVDALRHFDWWEGIG
jgi:energy-coupling factor transport system ATP-binding protein